MADTRPPASCGTHPGLGPFPSDPDNPSGINARAIFGGIRVTWNYPGVNPEGLAHFRLYRSVGSTANRSQFATVAGTSFTDNTDLSDAGTRFFYWVEGVSMNGTVGALIGPASAVAGSQTEDIFAFIAGQIDASALAASLRSEIESISSLRGELVNAETNRLTAYDNLLAALARLGIDITEANALVIDERNARLTENEAFAQTISGVVATINGNYAVLLEERTARTNAIESVVSELVTLNAGFETNQAAIEDESTARADAVSAEASRITTLSAISQKVFRQNRPPSAAEGRIEGSIWYDVNDGNEAFVFENGAWRAADQASIPTYFAAVKSERAARTDADGALAQDLVQLESDLTGPNGEIASRILDYNRTQVGYCELNGRPSTNSNHDTKARCENAGGTWKDLQALGEYVRQIDVDGANGRGSLQQRAQVIENDLGEVQAEYTVKIDVDNNGNPIVGGFGLATNNDYPPLIEAGFDVDRFWIGKTGQKTYPFVFQNNTLYVRDAVIKNLSVDTLKLKGGAVSVTDTTVFQSAGMLRYKNPGSNNNPDWDFFSGTGSGQGTAGSYPTGNVSVNRSNFDSASMIIGGVPGERYTVQIDVEFEYVIKARPSSTAYGLIFTPHLYFYRGEGGGLTRARLPPIRMNAQLAQTHPVGGVYNARYHYGGAGSGRLFYARLDQDTTFSLEGYTNSGATIVYGNSTKSQVLDYVLMIKPKYTMTVLFR